MKRCVGFVLILFAGLLTGAADTLQAVERQSLLFTDQQLETIGLSRSWFAQVTLDAQKEEVTHVVLQDNTLFITTESGRVQAIDCANGTTLWERAVGNSKYETYRPAANSKVVAVVNGTTLYLFDRFNGKELLNSPLFGQPIAGAQASERFIYVPHLSQKIFVYPMVQLIPKRENLTTSLQLMKDVKKNLQFSEDVEKKIDQTLKKEEKLQYLVQPIDSNDIKYCVSLGVSLTNPTMNSQRLSEEYICWTTTMGWLMIGRVDFNIGKGDFELLYKIAITPQVMYLDSRRLGSRFSEATNDIAASPTFIPQDISWENMNLPEDKRKGGLILTGTADGHVLAINNETGQVRWKFMTETGIEERIFAHNEQCFVPTRNGNLFCVSINTGREIWHTANIRRLIAFSQNAFYAIDLDGNLRVFNLETGKDMGMLPLPKFKFQLFNEESDRIFFVSSDGLVQCLRETNQVKPLKFKVSSMEIADRLAKELAASLEGKQTPVNVDPKVHAAQPPVAPVAPDAAKPAEPKKEEPKKAEPKKEEAKPADGMDDIFGEATGAKPKPVDKKAEQKAEKKAKESDPFGDDDIFK